jgi:hypothetical protein
MLVAAFDPGRNIGFALVDGQGNLLESRVVERDELSGLEIPEGAITVVGDGTGSAELIRLLGPRGKEAAVVDETGTSLEGRRLYFRDRPPRCPWRWLPRGMWWTSRQIDDYAAYAIALRYLLRLGAEPASTSTTTAGGHVPPGQPG